MILCCKVYEITKNRFFKKILKQSTYRPKNFNSILLSAIVYGNSETKSLDKNIYQVIEVLDSFQSSIG